MKKKELNPDALELSAEYMKAECGNISDLPLELRNTVANVYYRFFASAAHYLNKENALKTLSIKELRNELVAKKDVPLDSQEPETDFKEIAKTIAACESLPVFLDELREIKKHKSLVEYKKAIEFIYDTFKYNIKDAKSKLLIHRVIERKFKTQLEELPGLIEKMDKF